MNETMLHLKLDWRIISTLLLLAIVGMLAVWRPWQPQVPAKTITVTGQAIVRHEPDLFRFQPTFQDTDAKKVTAAGNDAVNRLKQLGIKDADIKTDVSSNQPPQPESLNSSAGTAPTLPSIRANTFATYTITFSTANKSLAQQAADYLATTSATGQITPQTGFDQATQTRLDLQARSQASDDAKQKAGVLAKQLGSKVGKVMKVTEGGSGIQPLSLAAPAKNPGAASSAGPIVQPGTGEVEYTFTVEFELK